MFSQKVYYLFALFYKKEKYMLKSSKSYIYFNNPKNKRLFKKTVKWKLRNWKRHSIYKNHQNHFKIFYLHKSRVYSVFKNCKLWELSCFWNSRDKSIMEKEMKNVNHRERHYLHPTFKPFKNTK